MHILTPRILPFTIFVIAYFIGFLAAAIMGGNHEFIFYECAMAIIIAVVVWMDTRVSFSKVVLCGLCLWGLMHLAGGLVPIPQSITEPGPDMPLVLYNMRLQPWLPKYDQIVHALGFGISAIASHEALSAHLKQKLPINFVIGAAVFFMAIGLGALNEIIEFFAVLMMPQTNVGGYINTGWDLVSNATGALIGILYLKVRQS